MKREFIRASLRRAALLLLSIAIGIVYPSTELRGQPYLAFGRIIVNWPEIRLNYIVRCGSDLRLDLTKANFRILEEGREIGDFEVRCPDPSRHCCLSVALAIDKSSGMRYGSPSALSIAQSYAYAFIDAMDPDGSGCDEAAIVTFDTLSTPPETMINDKIQLKLMIDGLTAGGDSRIWDGAMAGLEEIVYNGTQECRALILLTGGVDNSSRASPDDVIELALNNKLRVYTIGLGAGLREDDLQRIAADTGGKYYRAPQPGVLAGIYKEIVTLPVNWDGDCEIIYNSRCPDRSLRRVDLTLLNLPGCPGSDTGTKWYRPPLDTTGFTPVLFIAAPDTVPSNGFFSSPLLIASPAGRLIPPLETDFLFDTTKLTCIGFDTGECILDTVISSVAILFDTLRIRTSESISAPSVAPLLNLHFLARRVEGETVTALAPAAAIPRSGCIAPALLPGNLLILPSLSGDFPSEGSVLFGGEEYLLRWKLLNTFVVDLELSRDSGQTFQLVAAGVQADSMRWRVPPDLPSESAYRFRTRGADGKYHLVGQGNFIIDQPPRIIVEPEDATVCLGGEAEFHAEADSSLHSPVQWQKTINRGVTWKNIPGASSDTLHATASTPLDDGSLFRARYFSPYFTRETRSAKMSLNYTPELFHPPADQITCAGENARFEVHPTAPLTVTIQWQSSSNGRDWSDLPGENAEKLSIQNVQQALNGNRYRAIISNACGSYTSPEARLTVQMPPSILQQPQSRVVREGESVTLSFSASGTDLHFLWMKESIPLRDRFGSSFSIAPVRKQDAGTYHAIVRGSCGDKLFTDVVTIVVESSTSAPPDPSAREIHLSPSYPNPFSAGVSIGFSLGASSRLELKIFDLHGRSIRNLLSDRIEPGEHLVAWDGRNESGKMVDPGIYYAVLAVAEKVTVRKLTVVR